MSLIPADDDKYSSEGLLLPFTFVVPPKLSRKVIQFWFLQAKDLLLEV